MAQTTSVLWSVDQGLGEKAKEQARQNIGAASEKLTEVVNNHTEKIEANTTEIGQIKVDVADIESSLLNKKDKQQLKSFKGSSKQTIKNISQTENGELSVEFEVIDFPDFKLPSDVVRDSNYVHIDGATEVPLKDGITSVGVSTKYAREDHIHPTDTSREAIANKTTVILGTSNDKYPTDEAVAKFVNSSIATNTANYISNNGNPFTSVEQLNAYTGTVTNNDYAFVNGIDSDGNAYYDRYKATVNGSSVTWSLEYRLNNSSFTAAQWSAINSGITSALVAKIHEHSNKAVLDGITSDNVSNWNNKMDNQTVGGASEPVYLENGIAKIATGVATKTDLNNLTDVVDNHTTEIGQITESVEGIESSLTNKKDKQSANTFTGSSTKTIKNISQDENGELNVEFEDIDLSKRVAVNLNQDFTPEEMAIARNNISAADASSLKRLSNSVQDLTYKVAVNTNVIESMQWTKKDVKLSASVETPLLTVGNLIIGYHFDNAVNFRLSMKSTSGTRYIYLSDNMGYGGGYQVTDSSWNGITMRGFSGGCQYESFIGYDCTADKPIHFEVQFATSPNTSFGTICLYRVLEE